jgi:hypothetical protein
VRENVIIAYRGANFELGQWPHGYGIWTAGSPEPLPIEWWAPTTDGWSAAWYRFAALEVPGTIVAVSQAGAEPPAAPHSGSASQTAAAAFPQDAAPTGAGPTAAGTTGPASPAGPAPASAGTGSGSVTQPVQPAAPAGSTAPIVGPMLGATHATPAGGPLAGQPWAPVPDAGSRWTTVTASDPQVSDRRYLIGAGLLAVGVVLGIVGLFPAYLTGNSLVSQADNLWPHLIYLAGWAVSAVLIFRPGAAGRRIGALLGLGISVVTLGLFLADLGYPIAEGSSLMGAGLALSLTGWLACAAGSVTVFGRWPSDWPRRAVGAQVAAVSTVIAAAVGAAITFAPSWDSYTLTTSAGTTQTMTAGNAFANPGAVIFGELVVMVAVVAAIVVAALWRPGRWGWALAAGALLPLVAQAVSALVQVSEGTTAAQLGISSSEAEAVGLRITSGLTPWFWVYCLFLLVLAAGCVWLAANREEPALTPVGPGFGGPAAYGMPGPTVMAGTWPGAHAGPAAGAGAGIGDSAAPADRTGPDEPGNGG